MTFIVATLLAALAILAIAGLLVQRRALRESVEQFRLRADQAPVLIWTARPETTLDYLNGFCVQLTGRPVDELRENGWLDFVHPEDVQRWRLGEYHVSEELRQELVELQQQTLKLARNVRQLSHDLHPAVLQHLGLVKGLTSYCSELGRAHGLAMTCTAEGDFGAITPDAALCVYRIAQEALRNVIAHAGASRADVRLLQMGDQAQITITDDGRGFDATNRMERGTGLGLVSMSERARIIGGTVSIVSGQNQGTQVQATIL